jgi:demethylmenaquinone methyltransferase/2-methoxy-6-polyprenyl-1,4-benzoquinol methylase
MFDAVARRYDFMNSLATLGHERSWRSSVVAALSPQPGETILDLAAGTGTSAAPLARHGARVVGLDLSLGMIKRGRDRHPDLTFVAGDALQLPFADSVFDAATVSFGLRNMNDINAALHEMRRVVRPGGRLVICEFSKPSWSLLNASYGFWIQRVLPHFADIASSNPKAYRYLIESISQWPDQQTLADVITAAGWSDVAWRNLTGGVVALHWTRRPLELEPPPVAASARQLGPGGA